MTLDTTDLVITYRWIRKSKYFFSSITLLSILLFLVFAVRPAILESLRAYKELQNIKKVENGLLSKIEKLHEIEEILISEKENLEKLQIQIPQKSNESDLTAKLSNYCKNNNLIMNEITFSFESPSPKSQYQTLSFVLQVEGETTKFVDFLSDIENSSRLIKIDSIEIESQKDQSGEKTLRSDATLEGKAYYKTDNIVLENN